MLAAHVQCECDTPEEEYTQNYLKGYVGLVIQIKYKSFEALMLLNNNNVNEFAITSYDEARVADLQGASDICCLCAPGLN